MSKCMYICPSCGRVQALHEPGQCTNCGGSLISLQCSEDEWNTWSAMSPEKQQEIQSRYVNAPPSSDDAPPAGSYVPDESKWVTFLRALAFIHIVLGCIVSVVLGVSLGNVIGNRVTLIIILAGVLLSFGRVAVIMVFLNMASDIRSMEYSLQDVSYSVGMIGRYLYDGPTDDPDAHPAPDASEREKQ